MRFGIMTMQLDQLVPPALPPEQVLSYLGGFDLAALVRRLAEKGFSSIELGGDLSLFLPFAFAPAAVARLAALKAELGLSYTVHLPLWSVEPSTPLQPVRAGSVQALIDCVRAVQSLEPEAYVVHATGALAAEFYQMRLPPVAKNLILRQFQGGAQESLRAVLSQTGLPSRKLAIETVEFPFEMTLALAEALDTSICFDTGHVLVGFSGPVDFFDALERVLPRLIEVHLHDGPWQGPHRNIGYGKDHQALGRGDLDLGRFLDRLRDAHFQGPLVFELTVAEALASLDVVWQTRPEALENR
jgi:sugar phosphate isomerase/epimerase